MPDQPDQTTDRAPGPSIGVPASATPIAPDAKRIVILGSSNGAGWGASTFRQDPGPADGYASPATSWAGLLAAALRAIDPAWTIINRSIGGVGTVSSVSRFWTDVAPHRPSHVILCTHPQNDGFDYPLILRNTEMLCRMCDAIGAVPILRGAYPTAAYDAEQYREALALNQALDRLGHYRIDHMSTMDDGNGHLVGGSAYHVGDGLHLLDGGQEIQFRAIDLGVFLHAKRQPESAWSVAASSRGTGIVLNAASGLVLPPRSFTMRARIKGYAEDGPAARAFLCAYAQGAPGFAAPIRIRNAAGPYDVADGEARFPTLATVDPRSDAAVHDLVLVVNHATATVAGYVDGVPFAHATPKLALVPCETFVFGSRGESGNPTQATGYTFSNLAVWNVALRPETVLDIHGRNRIPKAGLIFAADMSGLPNVGGAVPNRVPNGLYGVIGEAVWQVAPAQ